MDDESADTLEPEPEAKPEPEAEDATDTMEGGRDEVVDEAEETRDSIVVGV